MPGYEIYSATGTLICRLNRGNYTPILDAELRESVTSIMDKDEEGNALDVNDVEIVEYATDVYVERQQNMSETGEIPRFDGSTEPTSSWEPKIISMLKEVQQ